MLYVRETPNGKKQYVDITGFRPVSEQEIEAQRIAREEAERLKALEEQKKSIRNQIAALKNNFNKTRYIQEKWVDGALTDEEYEPYRIERQKWRDQINALEAELAALEV